MPSITPVTGSLLALTLFLSGLQVGASIQSTRQKPTGQPAVASAPFTREYVVTTGYCNGPPCTNTTHGITKSGDKARVGTCAADWTVFPQGTELIVPGYGYCRVADTGRLIKGRAIDLYFDSVLEARQWGHRVQHVWRVTH